MENFNKIPEDINDKLFKVKYKNADKSHLRPDESHCNKCFSKCCTIVCPANVYEWDDKLNKLIVGYENCLECGACRIGCEMSAIEWEYPQAGFGVSFKYG